MSPRSKFEAAGEPKMFICLSLREILSQKVFIFSTEQNFWVFSWNYLAYFPGSVEYLQFPEKMFMGTEQRKFLKGLGMELLLSFFSKVSSSVLSTEILK